MSKYNATLMILLMGLSAFAGMAPLPLVGADSANGGNDAADTEATATVVPNENTWYDGDVTRFATTQPGSDNNDYYQIAVNANDLIEIQVIGPSNDWVEFGHRMDDVTGYSYYSVNDAYTRIYQLWNNDSTGKILYTVFSPVETNGNPYEYCFQVFHHSNTSQPPAEECFAPPAPAVSNVVISNTESDNTGWASWIVDFLNQTSGNEVVFNWTLSHATDAGATPEVQETGQMQWTATESDTWEYLEWHDLAVGVWCLDVTMWEQDDDGGSFTTDTTCTTIDTASSEEPSLYVATEQTHWDNGEEAIIEFIIEGLDTSPSASAAWVLEWDLYQIGGDDSTITEGGSETLDVQADGSAQYGLNFFEMNVDLSDVDGCFELQADVADDSLSTVAGPITIKFSVGNDDCDDGEEGPSLYVDPVEQKDSYTDAEIDVIIEVEGMSGEESYMVTYQVCDYNTETEDNCPLSGQFSTSFDDHGPSHSVTVTLDVLGYEWDRCLTLEVDLYDESNSMEITGEDWSFVMGNGNCDDEEEPGSEENSWCAQLEGFAGAVWDSLFTYSPGDVVEYPANSGLFYRAKSTTSGDLPDENPDAWEGPCTCADIWAGEHWIDTTSYPEYLVVEFNGEFWISLMPGNLGNVPSISPEYWRPCEGDETNPCAQHGGAAGPVYDQAKQYYMKGEIVEYPANSGVFYISNYDYSTSHPSNGRWTKCTCSEIHDGTQYQSGTSYPDWKVVEHAGELYIRTPTTWIYTQGDPEPEQTKFWWIFWRVCSPEGCEQESVGQYDSANWAIYDVDVVVQHPSFSGKYWRSQMEDNTNTPPSHWARCFRESIGDDDHTVPDMTVLPWDPDSEVVDTWVDKDHAMARYGGADVMVLGPPESKGPGDPLQGVIISLSTATDPECDDVTGPSDPIGGLDIGSAAECDGEFEIEAYPGDRLTFAGETCNGLSDRGLDSTQTTCEDRVVLIPRRYLPDADDGVLARDIGGHLIIEATGCWVGEVSDDVEGPTDPISGIDWRAECPPRGDGESKPVLTMDRVPAIIVGECAMEHMEDIGVFLPEDERPAQEFGRVDSVSSTTVDDGGDIAARSISGRGPGDPIIDMDIGRIVTLDSSDESRFCGARLVVRDSDVQGPSDPISSLDIGSILDIPDNAGTYFEIDGEEYFVWNVLGMTCAAIHAPGMDCEDAIVRLGDATVEDPDDVQGPSDPISNIDIGSNADCDSGTTSEAEGLDSDCDGVPNAWDDCPDTSSDAVGTDRNGCDITAETVTEAADSGAVPGFLAIFSMVAMVAAAVAVGRSRERSANRR